MPTFQERHQLARANVYRLLSACYYQPELAFLEERVFSQMAGSMAVAAPQWVPETSRLEELFRGTGVESLLLDYTRLFLGPFGILAKPYGSIYLDGDKQVMGESTVNAQNLYREFGFDVDENFREAPDHVAVELEFLYLLSHGIAVAVSDSQEAVRLTALKQRFLEQHLGRWVEPFSSAVCSGAETGYYRGLAELTRNFVIDDLEELRTTRS